MRLGEEIIGHILPGMFDRDSGRVIPRDVLAELGNSDPIAGRKVLRKFLANIRRDPAYAANAVNPQELARQIPPNRLRQLLGGVENISHAA